VFGFLSLGTSANYSWWIFFVDFPAIIDTGGEMFPRRGWVSDFRTAKTLMNHTMC
jgi:hypothetical protein